MEKMVADRLQKYHAGALILPSRSRSNSLEQLTGAAHIKLAGCRYISAMYEMVPESRYFGWQRVALLMKKQREPLMVCNTE